jgi:HSP20 family protein
MNRLFLPVSSVPTSLNGFATHIDSVVDRILGSAATDEDSAPSEYVPRLDVYEHEASVEIFMDLPGILSSELKVEVKDHVLTISGERTGPSFGESTKSWHRGIPYGKFQRKIQLAETCNTDAIQATYDSGVLRLMVPKTPKPTPKVIEVRMAEPANISSS